MAKAMDAAGAPQPTDNAAPSSPSSSPSVVDSASNGQEVIDKMKSLHYDVVFMDMQMPKYSGLEATQIINKWYQEKEIRKQHPIKPFIIALTANALDKHGAVFASWDVGLRCKALHDENTAAIAIECWGIRVRQNGRQTKG